jgi:hypothetical protein
MALDRGRTARGALAGALAAAAWAAQQPLDRRLFGVDHDDVALLGKAVTRGRAWPAAGLALHLLNGAAFGALYANAATRTRVPSWARGPAAALAEHVATWPLLGVVERVHPARDELPRLAASARAFAQSAWRHALFGAVLGELERRLNPPREDEAPIPSPHAGSSNGHGDLEAALTGAA